MLCQYSTHGLVSRGKRDRALDPGAADGSGDASDIATGTVIVDRSGTLSELLTAITPRAHATHVWRSRSRGRWSIEYTWLDGLAPDFQGVTQDTTLSRGRAPWGRLATTPRDAHQCVRNVPCIMMY
jgi:hypothetical protein